MHVNWKGVFPAITTQFHPDQSLNLEATARHLEAMIGAGIHGVVFLGTVGENTALEYPEKLAVLREMKQVVNGRIPMLTGVAEYTTALGCRFARDAEKAGVDGLMVLPAMVYKSDERETLTHYRTVARATGLPILVYNNPVSYGVDIKPEAFARLADEPTLVAIKESSEDVRRITDLRNIVGTRYTLFAGVDDLVLESILLGAQGWISGLVNAFPKRIAPYGNWRLPANGKRRGTSTAGTHRCCTWIPKSSWCNTSSSRCRRWDWGRRWCAHRACRSKASNAKRFWGLSGMPSQPDRRSRQRRSAHDSH